MFIKDRFIRQGRLLILKLKGINWGRAAVFVFLLFIVPLLALVAVEYFHRGGIPQLSQWLTEKRGQFFFSLGVAFFVNLFFLSLTKSPYRGFLLFAAAVILFGATSYYKTQFLKEPLLPWDLFLYREAGKVWPFIYKEVDLEFLLLPLFLFVVSWRPAGQAVLRIKPFLRAGMLVVALVVLSSFAFYNRTPVEAMMRSSGFREIPEDQLLYYQESGVVLGFFTNLKNAFVFEPKNYNAENINAIVAGVKDDLGRVSSLKSKKIYPQKPNIIVVMSESLWDPTVMPNVSYSKDPLATYHSFIGKFATGSLLSPQFGGRTANVEFEVLTGLSMTFLPKGSVPYMQYINEPYYSLAAFLREQGYRTTAIHPYDKTFWRRDKVYPLLGFERFLSEEDFAGARKEWLYVTDEEVAKAVIRETKGSPESDFIFVVTMENHSPHHKEKYGHDKLALKTNLSDESKTSLEIYGKGVANADKALKILTDYYRQSKEPTIIVLFGDHLPPLGQGLLPYKETGFLQSEENWTLDEYRKMRSTPLLIWNNFTPHQEKIQALSPAFLAPKILNLTSLDQPPYYRFLDKFQKNMPGFTSEIKIDSKGNLYQAMPLDMKEMEDNYRLIQYDLLFGQKYGQKALFPSN